MNHKAYPVYKESNICWLGAMPAHWKAEKLRTILKPINKRNRPDLQLLSIAREKGVLKRNISDKNENHNYIPDDLSNYKVVAPGQFAMNKMKAWQGSYGISQHLGIVSPAYYVFDLKNVEADFFHLAIRSKTYVPFFTQASDGVRVGQWDLSLNRMREIPFFIPAADEQKAIVRFVNFKNIQINKFIQKKKRLITLLKEQKQAIINQAVTSGLDPNVRLKPSGVEWLGDIPETWGFKKLKFLVKNHAEQTSKKADNEVYIALEHVESWTGKLNLSEEEIHFESIVKRFKSGDILFGKLRPYLAKVIKTKQDGVCVGEFLVLRNIENFLITDYLEVVLRSKKIIDIITASTFGAKMPRADWNFIGNLLIPYPSTSEQLKIVDFMSTRTGQIDKKISYIEQQIDLIQEYRTRLIADVVTGKIDIRNIKIEEFDDSDIQDELIDIEELDEEPLALAEVADEDD